MATHGHRWATWTVALMPWLSRAEGFAWRLVCKANETRWQAVVEERRPIQHGPPAKWMAERWRRMGFPDPHALVGALAQYAHCAAGSDVLAALLAPVDWTPHDLDLVGFSEDTGDRPPIKTPYNPSVLRAPYPLSHELFHHTAFIHDAFGFTGRFYTDAEMTALGKQAPTSGQLAERLDVAVQRDGYELLPAWIRSYRFVDRACRRFHMNRIDHAFRPRPTASEGPDDGDGDSDVGPEDDGDGDDDVGPEDDGDGDSDVKVEQSPPSRPVVDGCSLMFDYILVRRGLGPEVTPIIAQYLPVQAGRGRNDLVELVRDYAGRDGHASLPSFFDARRELPFCNVLFDGRRFRVQDWDAVWTQSAIVTGPALDTRDSHAIIHRKWYRLLRRIGKYRDRHFTVEFAADVSFEALRRAGPLPSHMSPPTQPFRRMSVPVTVPEREDAQDRERPWAYEPGLFDRGGERWYAGRP